MATVQPSQSCDLFSFLHAPGATDAYWDLLERAGESISTTDNCVISRFYAVSALVQVPIELVLATLNGIKKATVNTVFAFLACDGNKGMEFFKDGLFAVLHAVKLVVALPFLLLGAITGWPREVIAGVAKTNPNRENNKPTTVDDALKLSTNVGLMMETVKQMNDSVTRLVAAVEPHDNVSESDAGSIEEVSRT